MAEALDTPTVPPIKGMPALSSSKRASSAPTKERPPPPLTPRARKASRSLFRELEGTVMTMHHAHKRTEQTFRIVVGTMGELQSSVSSADQTLTANKVMVAGTKDTEPGKQGGPKAPKGDSPSSSTVSVRPLTEVEREVLRREMRDELDAAGDERDPTDEEIDEVAKKRLDTLKMSKESMKRINSAANKPIVEGLHKLKESSAKSIIELQSHERNLARMLDKLDEIIALLTKHKNNRDSLFDPLLSTDLPFARGKKPIKRSVLYQKMNFVPKDEYGQDMKCDWNDKDQEAIEGKLDLPNLKKDVEMGKLTCSTHLLGNNMLDAKGNKGLTAHESTFCAAEREDEARALCNAALKCVRSSQSQLALRKSQLQVAVLNSRQQVLKGKRALKSGKFGSSEERNTDPSTRKMASNPEDT